LEAIGDLARLPPDVIEAFEEAQLATRQGDRIEFVLALNYGARDEIRRAMLSIFKEIEQGQLRKMTYQRQRSALPRYSAVEGSRTSYPYQWRIPPEQLPPLAALYAEVHVTDVLWPDFSPSDLLHAVLDYQQRTRNWGK